jgi:hypothetical protein
VEEEEAFCQKLLLLLRYHLKSKQEEEARPKKVIDLNLLSMELQLLIP